MITEPPGVRIWLAARPVDMRKGFDGLAAVVQQQFGQDPFSGQIFAFRGKRGDLLKLLVWDGQGFLLVAKRLERGRFVWPSPAAERVRLPNGSGCRRLNSRCCWRGLTGEPCAAPMSRARA